jgi:tripartite-type tricarboxylate transporter receptor subunit TctC
MRLAHNLPAAVIAIFALVALVVLAGPVPALAQAYPVKPVKVIVPYPPGGATDIAARLMAQALSESLGQPFVVENRPGAGGMPALEQVARADADGYTLIVPSTGPATISPLLYKSRGFDPLARLQPIILFASAPGIILVRNGLPAKSIVELLALSRASPGRLTMASAGNGSLQHLLGEYFQNDTGVKWTHIPYKGSAPALTELVGDRVDIMVDVVPSAAPYVKAGKMRALAVTTPRRSSQLPEVPSLEELGIKGYDKSGWHALLAPRGTPPEIVGRLNATLNRALQSGEMKAKLAGIGADPDGGPPERLEELMRAELRHWAEVIRISGAVAE